MDVQRDGPIRWAQKEPYFSKGESMPTEPREHLIKRNPDLAQAGVLTTSKGVHHFTESSVRGRPPGHKARGGERIWVAESGYGIYAEGSLLSDPVLHTFTSIDHLLDEIDRIPVQDDPYIMKLIRKINQTKNFKHLHVLVVATNVSDLGSVIEVPKELRTQGSWYYLEPGQIQRDTAGQTLQLSPNIPGAVRLRVYQRLAKKSDLHIIDVDHFVPRVVGGPGNIEENLVPVSFSLNRAKNARIPSGLFDVASTQTDLSLHVPGKFTGGEPRYLHGPDVRDAAKKVVAAVNRREDLDAVRAFYQAVVNHHFLA